VGELEENVGKKGRTSKVLDGRSIRHDEVSVNGSLDVRNVTAPFVSTSYLERSWELETGGEQRERAPAQARLTSLTSESFTAYLDVRRLIQVGPLLST
jgi:hypothetical protein